MGINSAVLSGNVGKPPEIRYLDSGKVLAVFSIAVQGFKNGERVPLWFECKAWDKMAELVGEYVKQGSPVTISGNLDIEKWEKDGHNFSKTILNVRDIQLPPKAD